MVLWQSILLQLLLLPTCWAALQENQHYRPFVRQKSINTRDLFLYRKGIFQPQELATIRNQLSTHPFNSPSLLLPEDENSVAQRRLGITLPSNSPATKIFRQGSIVQWIRNCTNNSNYVFCEHVPLELRVYPLGAHMPWHVDDVLCTPVPQLEVVWTLENNSNSQTLYRTNDRTYAIDTETNAVLLLQAGGLPHCVTKVRRGERKILKCVYWDPTQSTWDPYAFNQKQFFRTRNNKQRKNQRSR